MKVQGCENLFSGWNLEIRTNLANISFFSFQDAALREIHVVHGMSNFSNNIMNYLSISFGFDLN